jgi:D-lactate dehydrogenase
MKVLIYSAHRYEVPFLEKAAFGRHELRFTEKKLSLETALLANGYDAVAIFTADDASESVLRELARHGVMYVALRSSGFDHVALGVAGQLGIRVANVPAYSPYAIAEHAVALLQALNRKIALGQTLIRLQDFRLDSLVGFDIHGKTVGIVGTGTIGVAFARIMNGFGARLVATDPVPNDEALKLGVAYISLDDLLSQSDIVSLHCPLNANTRHLIRAERISLMKKNAILINTSRGGVVKTVDLVEALEAGVIGGACLDVYENEKSLFFEDHRAHPLADVLFTRLRSNRNVIITGHQAFLTVEALEGIAKATMNNLDHWCTGKPSPNELHTASQSVIAPCH